MVEVGPGRFELHTGSSQTYRSMRALQIGAVFGLQSEPADMEPARRQSSLPFRAADDGR